MAMTLGTAGQMPDEVKNGLFLQGSQSWTLTAGWALSKDPRGLAHTAGVTTVEQTTSATVTTVTYEIEVGVSGLTAGTLTIQAGTGDVTTSVISANGITNYETVFLTDVKLILTPTTDFDGTILYVRVRALKVQP